MRSTRGIVATASLLLALGSVGTVAESEVRANGLPVEASSLAPILEAARKARVVHLVGDVEGQAPILNDARRRLIRMLHERADYDVLVLPVGIFEGVWVDAALASRPPQEAAAPLYRVWREDESFLRILAYVASTGSGDDRLNLLGGLCRFHATGKELYGRHLAEWFAEDGELWPESLAQRVATLWAGRDRLSRATPETRAEAARLADAVLARFDQVREALVERHGASRVQLERQFLVNMRRFVELESIRGGDREDDGSFTTVEKGANLEWFLGERFPDSRLIYWEGRGERREPLPTKAEVFTVELTVEP